MSIYPPIPESLQPIEVEHTRTTYKSFVIRVREGHVYYNKINSHNIGLVILGTLLGFDNSPLGVGVTDGHIAVTAQFMGGNKWNVAWLDRAKRRHQQFVYTLNPLFHMERILAERSAKLSVTRRPKFAPVRVY